MPDKKFEILPISEYVHDIYMHISLYHGDVGDLKEYIQQLISSDYSRLDSETQKKVFAQTMEHFKASPVLSKDFYNLAFFADRTNDIAREILMRYKIASTEQLVELEEAILNQRVVMSGRLIIALREELAKTLA